MERVPLFCSTCGAPARRCPAPARRERLRAWFVDGDRGRGERYECYNGHGWRLMTAHVSPGFKIRVSQLWRAIAYNRTVIPTPQSYTVAAGIGLIVGVTWNLLLGWPWWLGPVVFVVASWFVALSTAIRGPQRAWTIRAVHDQLRPGGAKDRRDKQTRRDIEEMSFAAVGFVEHAESPHLGGVGGDGVHVTSITISYGHPRVDTSPFVEVVTTIVRDPPRLVMRLQGDWLRRMAAGPSHLPSSDPSMLSAEVSWSPIDITIDNAPRSAHQASLGDHWAVVVDDSPHRIVVIEGHRGATLVTALKHLDATEYTTEPDF